MFSNIFQIFCRRKLWRKQYKNRKCYRKMLINSLIGRCSLSLPPRDGSGWEAFSRNQPQLFLLLKLLIFFSLLFSVHGAVPRFFESNRMSILLLPEDIEVGTIIYRLRAEDADRDYPLSFRVRGTIGTNLIDIETHECTPSKNIYCEADVKLIRSIERGRIYIFNLTVLDQRGQQTEVVARIDGNSGRATAISQIFLRFPPSVVIREDIPPKAVIASIIARRRLKATFGEFQVLGPAGKLFKAHSANLVSPDTINGTLIVDQQLNYEEANLHTFKVCLLQPYTDVEFDTRNIACVVMSVVIEDVQDEPPIFMKAAPVTRVPSSAIRGDIIGKIKAKDGDRGLPRDLRYSILPSSSLYTNYFRIDALTGEIAMNGSASSLREKMVSLDPILMTVTVEEVTGVADQYPALSSSVEIAFVVLDADLLVPKFVHEKYVGEIYEDSVPDSQVFFDSPFLVQGVKGLFALELDGDGGAFSVQPGVVKDASEIKIKVKNQFLIDYEEKPQINFKLIARQVSGPQQLTGSTEITVRLLDTNDNVPTFTKTQYEVEVYENITRGTTVVRVYATDKDSGPFGAIRYTRLIGPLADRLYLEQTTGVITCATHNHGFDREEASEYVMTVEAKDNSGQGAGANIATAKVILRMKDVNDSPPRFLETLYKGVMAPDYQRLRDPIRIRAVDEDAERPNNEIVYDLERSSYSDYFQINRNTGYLDVRQDLIPRFAGLKENKKGKVRVERQALLDNDTVINLRVRASDLGDPQLSETVDVKIFKQEFGERLIRFIYPKNYLEVRSNRRDIEKTLNTLTGGSTEILNAQPLSSGFLGSNLDPQRSEVTALVRFGVETVVDLQELMAKLNNSEVEKLKTERLEREEVIRSMEGQTHSYLVGVVLLCLILAIIIIIIILCCLCEGCPLYSQKKKYIHEEGETAYNRETKARGNLTDSSWFDVMPKFLRKLVISFGYIPPDKNKSRLAWSADERQRIWQMNNAHAADQGYVGNHPRGEVIMEDLDDGRFNRTGPRPDHFLRVDSRMSQRSQEPKRVFVIKDSRGQRLEGGMRGGDTYFIEDNDENQQNMGPITDRSLINGQEDEFGYNGQGNGQFLRLSASLPDAAFNNGQRRFRRPGAEPEELGRHFIDPGGGGLGGRYVEGGINREYVDDRYSMNAGYNNVYSQTDEKEQYPRMKSIKEESNEESNRVSRLKKTFKSDKISKVSDISRTKSSQSERSKEIPGTHGYQHTKTSILRYDSNKAKMDKEREELIKQGKDPDLCLINHGGRGDLEEKKLSVSNSKPPKEKYEHTERRGSLPDVESTTEDRRSFRKILQRRNSAGNLVVNDGQDDEPTENVVYVSEAYNPYLMQVPNRNNLGLRLGDNSIQIPYDTQLIQNNRQPVFANQNGLSLPVLNNLQAMNRNNYLVGTNQVSHNDILQGLNAGLPSVSPGAASLMQHQQQGLLTTQQLGMIPNQQLIDPQQQLLGLSNYSQQFGIVPNSQLGLNQQAGMVQQQQMGLANNLQASTFGSQQGIIGEQANNLNLQQVNSNDLSQQSEVPLLQQLAAKQIIPQSLIEEAPREFQTEMHSEEKLVHTIEKSTVEHKNESLNMPEKTQEINVPDDIKSANSKNKTRSKDKSESQLIVEKHSRNDHSVMNIPQDKPKRSKMLEKKSVFTIAYDGMKTDHLRPDTATKEP